jgi:hypothetical protein
MEQNAMTPHEMIAPVRKPSRFGAALRWVGLGALGVAGAVMALMLALVATMAALIGLVIAAGAVIALRFTPNVRLKREQTKLLEGRRTADGWVVEAVAPKSR